MKTKCEDGSFVHNCIITMRDTPFSYEEPLPDALFNIVPGGGKMITKLDGYAIVPKEKYEAMLSIIRGLNGMRAAMAMVDYVKPLEPPKGGA
jgi:hypothetical protein